MTMLVVIIIVLVLVAAVTLLSLYTSVNSGADKIGKWIERMLDDKEEKR